MPIPDFLPGWSIIKSISQPKRVRSLSSPLAVTATYCTAFLGLGLISAALGPSLPSLAQQTHVQLSQVSVLFTTINLGYLVGALAAGRYYDRRVGHPLMAGAL